MDTSRTADPSHPTSVASALRNVVIAIIPVAVAYFIGWAYLYDYLLEFGINVSELELGTESIVIYSVPPTLAILKGYGWLLALALLVVYLATAYRHLIPVPGAATRVLALAEPLRSVSNVVVWLLVFAAIVAVLSPLIHRVAIERADDKWTRTGIRLQTPLEPQSGSAVAYQDYRSCMERRALDLVFADKNVYYLLCVSEINDDAGVVYEVKRSDSKIASVRWSRRNPATGRESHEVPTSAKGFRHRGSFAGAGSGGG